MGKFFGTVDFDPGPGVFELTAHGVSNALHDIFILKLNTDGNFVWAGNVGPFSSGNGHGLALDQSGNVYTTGVFRITNDFDPGPGVFPLNPPFFLGHIFVLKLNRRGNFVWAAGMLGTVPDSLGTGWGIGAGPSGDVYTAGAFTRRIDFDPGVGVFELDIGDSLAVFVQKLDGGPPTVVAIDRTAYRFTDSSLVRFEVSFSEEVTGVDVTDFAIDFGGAKGSGGALVVGVAGSGYVYTVTVATGGLGTLSIDVIDDDTIVDIDGNPLGGFGAGNGNFTGGEAYEVVASVPGLGASALGVLLIGVLAVGFVLTRRGRTFSG